MKVPRVGGSQRDHPPGPTWSHTAHGAPLTMDHTQADVYETCLKVKHPTSEVNTSHEGGAVWCTKRKEKPTSKKTRKRKPRLAGPGANRANSLYLQSPPPFRLSPFSFLLSRHNSHRNRTALHRALYYADSIAPHAMGWPRALAVTRLLAPPVPCLRTVCVWVLTTVLDALAPLNSRIRGPEPGFEPSAAGISR